MADSNSQVFDDRDPDANRRRLFDPRTLLRARSITPDLLSLACFAPTTEKQAPGYHQERDAQARENGTADTVARSDHSHDETYLHKGGDRGVGTEDADWLDPISDVVDNIAAPGDDTQRREVLWTINPDSPPVEGPTLVWAAWSVDTGTTYTDYELVGVAPNGQDHLTYYARGYYDFGLATTVAKYRIQCPLHDKGTKLKLIRTGDDGKIDRAFLPSTVPTYASTGVGDANYAVLTTDRIVRTTAALTTPRTWTLPAASSFVAGQRVSIQDAAGGVTTTNTLTIAVTGGDLIDGASTLLLDSAYAGADLTSDGVSRWTVIVAGIEIGGTGATTAATARTALGVSRATLAYADGTVPGGNTVANTVTPTAFASSYTIPASRVQVGSVVRVSARGLFGTDVVAPTLTVALLFGATSMLSTGAVTLTAALGNTGWSFHADIVCKTAGAGGALEAQGSARLGATSTTEQAVALTNTAPVSVALNATQAVTIKVTWGTANANNTITLRTMVVEVMSTT